MKLKASFALVALVIVTGSFARAEVVAVVTRQSPITTLSKAQLADIFLGRLARLPDGTKLEPLDQEEGSPARDAFYSQVTGKSPAQMKAYWSKLIFTGRGRPPHVLLGNAALLRALRANPAAISYLDRAQVDSTLKIVL